MSCSGTNDYALPEIIAAGGWLEQRQQLCAPDPQAIHQASPVQRSRRTSLKIRMPHCSAECVTYDGLLQLLNCISQIWLPADFNSTDPD